MASDWSVPIGSGVWHIGDTFDVMRTLPSASVDMILCDLPYGTTQNKWDSVLPLDQLWAEYWRIAKPNAAIVLTAAQPFTSALVMSQPSRFKYDWTWRKSNGTGHLNAKKMPMRNKEDVLVFYASQPTYNPQRTTGHRAYTAAGTGAFRKTNTAKSDNYGKYNPSGSDNDGSRLPVQVIDFQQERGLHPTQKPVALFEYLIRTYTNPGDTVLDNTAGSGTTAVAAEQSGRRWICIERDEEYSLKAMARLAHY